MMNRTVWWVGVMAILLLWGTHAAAQVLPKALHDIKPATGECRRDDIVAGASHTPTAPEVAPDMSCALTVTQLQPLLAQPNTALMDLALMDLRGAGDYELFHIQQAQRITLPELLSKPYWRSKAVVLIGDGKAERELYGACARLKQAGYMKVHVLRGGMPQWLAHDQPVIGQAPAMQQLTRLSAAQLWQESENPDNLVLLNPAQKSLQTELTYSTVLPQTTHEAIEAVLQRRRSQLKGAPLASVVLAVDPAMTHQQIQQLQQALRPVPLLIYADTRAALVEQLARQRALWAAAARGPKQPACGK